MSYSLQTFWASTFYVFKSSVILRELHFWQQLFTPKPMNFFLKYLFSQNTDFTKSADIITLMANVKKQPHILSCINQFKLYQTFVGYSARNSEVLTDREKPLK